MPNINRNSVVDARNLFEKFLPQRETRLKVLDFIGTAIGLADTLNSENWNLNLDKNGQFVRFNVGHEYCIEINTKRILILCDRLTLQPKIFGKSIPVMFRGHIHKEKVDSLNIDEVPNCLAKTKNSIGCIINTEEIINNIDYFRESNLDFIKSAIKTKQIQLMKNAHSKGAIEYLALELECELNNPIYEITDLPTYSQFKETTERKINKARKISREKRLEKLSQYNPKPTKTVVCQTVFNRNPYVVAEVLERANGICEKCKNSAPFKKDIDNKPYLEVHHIIPLSEGGDDIVENAIALCPNCHRHTHYGKQTY